MIRQKVLRKQNFRTNEKRGFKTLLTLKITMMRWNVRLKGGFLDRWYYPVISNSGRFFKKYILVKFGCEREEPSKVPRNILSQSGLDFQTIIRLSMLTWPVMHFDWIDLCFRKNNVNKYINRFVLIRNLLLCVWPTGLTEILRKWLSSACFFWQGKEGWDTGYRVFWTLATCFMHVKKRAL